jgi:hypothetical protein
MARTTVEKVAFAEMPLTVHVKRTSEPGLLPDGTEAWDVESKLMSPGDSMPLSDMPPYLAEAIKAGEVEGIKLLTQKQIDERAELVRAIAKGLSTPASFAGRDDEPEERDDPEFPTEEY